MNVTGPYANSIKNLRQILYLGMYTYIYIYIYMIHTHIYREKKMNLIMGLSECKTGRLERKRK
jgi:hypothetical protein